MTFSRQGVISKFGPILKRIKQNPDASIASSLFLLSYFLPAYTISESTFTGFECFKICLTTICGISFEGIYYLGLALVNFVFMALVGISFTKQPFQMPVKILSIACTLYVVSWAILNTFHDDGSVFDFLRIGYYVWLSAFIYLSIALIRNKPHSNSINNQATSA